jgi:hypothetical protein
VKSVISFREEAVTGRFVPLITSSLLESTDIPKFIRLLPRAIMVITHSSAAVHFV